MTNELNNELRSILDTEGALTEDQVTRVDAIELEIAGLENEARSNDAKAKAEARLAAPTFGGGVNRVNDTTSDSQRFADWAIGGVENRTYSNSGDGALLPLDLQSDLVKILNGVAGVRQAVEAKTYGHDVQIARVAGRPSITGFTAETVAYGALEGTFDQVRSYAFKSTAISSITEELMQDSRPAVLAEIMEAQMAAHGLFWDAQFAVDGAGAANGPEAIFNSTQAALNTMETAVSGDITLDDLLVAQLEALPAQYRAGSFSFLMHPTVESKLRREKDDSGRFQLLPQAAGTDAGMPGSTIHGVPVVISTNAPTLAEAQADNGVVAAMLMNKSSYRIFDRMPLSTMRDEFTGSATGEVKFLSKMRSDGRWLAPWTSVAVSVKA